MSKLGMGESPLGPDDIAGARTEWHKPASPKAVNEILGADPDLPDGFTRSEFLWIRLANGDLVLGVFPQDEAYFAYEEEHSF